MDVRARLRRSAAAASLLAVLGGSVLSAAVLAGPAAADADGYASSRAAAQPRESPPVFGSSAPASGQTSTAASPSAVVTSAAPTSAPTHTTVTSSPSPRGGGTPTPRVSGTARPSGSATATGRPSPSKRSRVPVAAPSNEPPAQTGPVESADPFPYTGSSDELPAGAAASGSPAVTETLKPGSTADPVYSEAATGTVTKRKYIKVDGFSVNGALGWGALAGALLGLVGGVGLWLTRGSR